MFLTYLRRELRHRRKQSTIVAVGLAVAVALVMVVSSVSSGVGAAQASVLESVYGVGTDVTVSQTSAPAQPGEGGGRPDMQFEFGTSDGTTSADGTTEISQTQLAVSRGTESFPEDAATTAAGTEHVSGVAAALTLEQTVFDGALPSAPAEDTAEGSSDDAAGMPQGVPGGARGGFGGGGFGIDSTTVTGVQTDADAVGPLTAVTVSDGRGLEADDADADVAVLDSVYASTEGLAVGDTVTVGEVEAEVVGIVSSTSGEGVATSSDVYVPLGLAQTAAGLDGQVTDLYVAVDSASNVEDVATALETDLPDATVSTQSDLASGVTGSLSSAASLVQGLGLWLSVAVLVAAFGLAVLFTVSGVNRRTRELGTLKALGWRSRRVVGQVAGESVVQGLLGGVAGVVLGGIAVTVVNLLGITLSGSASGGGFSLGGRAGAVPGGGAQGAAAGMPTATPGDGGGPFGQMTDAASSAVDVVLHASVSPWIVLAAVGLAVLGGLVAGVVGGARAARLRPAEALRSVA